jgi:uncharacterized membrane protein
MSTATTRSHSSDDRPIDDFNDEPFWSQKVNPVTNNLNVTLPKHDTQHCVTDVLKLS